MAIGDESPTVDLSEQGIAGPGGQVFTDVTLADGVQTRRIPVNAHVIVGTGKPGELPVLKLAGDVQPHELVLEDFNQAPGISVSLKLEATPPGPEGRSEQEKVEWKTKSLKDIEKSLESSLGVFEEDAGHKALEALRSHNRKTRNKKVRGRWIKFWIFLFFMMIVAGVVGYGRQTYVEEHHSMIRQCVVKFGDGTITGIREFYYTSKNLFGYELTESSAVESRTKVSLKGDKLTILGLDDNRKVYWRVNVNVGDRGEQILKPANEYIFIGDKADAMITADAFCK